jgi:hypothetical protein
MTRHAFVMGSNGPQNCDPLQYALRDVDKMQKCLSGPKCGFVVTVPRAGADVWEVRRQMIELMELCSEEDIFVCYFSGHGKVEKGSLMLFWDDTRVDRLLSTAISVRELLEGMRQCRAGNRLVILDCCHAGFVARMLGLKSDFRLSMEDLISSDNYTILMASDHLEQARELDMYQGSFLTANICAALTDSFHLADVDGDNSVSTQDLSRWLRKQAIEHNQAYPSLRVPIPYTTTNARGDFFLAIGDDEQTLVARTFAAKSPWHQEATIIEMGSRDAQTTQEEINATVTDILAFLDTVNSFALRLLALESLCAISGYYSDQTRAVLERLSQTAPQDELRWAATVAYRILRRNMIFIPPGVCVDGRGEHVECNPFYIDKYPVTTKEYHEFLAETDYVPSGIVQLEFLTSKNENHPVTGITYTDAVAYATWAGKRLPTENEWVRAAYADQAIDYPWGNEFEIERCNTLESGLLSTTPVAEFPTGQSQFGVFDLAGNVWEWISDDCGKTAIVRGGSWQHIKELASRKGRFVKKTIASSDSLGFRCARDMRVNLLNEWQHT